MSLREPICNLSSTDARLHPQGTSSPQYSTAPKSSTCWEPSVTAANGYAAYHAYRTSLTASSTPLVRPCSRLPPVLLPRSPGVPPCTFFLPSHLPCHVALRHAPSPTQPFSPCRPGSRSAWFLTDDVTRTTEGIGYSSLSLSTFPVASPSAASIVWIRARTSAT